MDLSKNPRKSSVLQRAFSLEKSIKIPKIQQNNSNNSTPSPMNDEDTQEKTYGIKSLRDVLEKNVDMHSLSPTNKKDIQEKKFGFKSLRDVVEKKLQRRNQNLGAKHGAMNSSVSSGGSEEELSSLNSFDSQEVGNCEEEESKGCVPETAIVPRSQPSRRSSQLKTRTKGHVGSKYSRKTNHKMFSMRFGRCEFTLCLEMRFLDPDELKENSEDDNFDKSVDPFQASLMRDRIIAFVTKQKSLFDKLLSKSIFKIPNVFGSMIEKICQREKCDVPTILTKIFALIETKQGFKETEGLYRINGNMATIQSLRFDIEDDNYLNLDKQTNVHILTGTVKLFFRELRVPLISWDLMVDLIAGLRKYENNTDEMVKHANKILNKLDKYHKNTLTAYLRHLNVILQHCNDNQVTPEKLAISIGPSLCWSLEENKKKERNTQGDLVNINNVIGFLIKNADRINLN